MKKEIDMGIFLEDDERYADVVNVFGNLPKGMVTKEVVEPYDTKMYATGTFFLLRSRAWQEGTKLQQRRKRLTTKHRDMVRRIIFGMNIVITELELQETVDYSYPLRDMIYTSGEYECQARKIRRSVRREKQKDKSRTIWRPGEYLYGFRKESRLHPTVIFLLYFGEEPWDGPTCIHDILDFTDIPKEMRALVQNHRINLIDVRRMSEEMLGRFQTDIGKVLRIIKNAENKEELKKLVETDPYYKEMEQDAYLVTANYIKADELLDYEKYEEEGGKCDMCRAIKELIEDGRLEGFESGQTVGFERGQTVGFERGQTVGFESGQTVGFERGQIYILSNLVHENVINPSEAAKQMGITEKEFLEVMNTESQGR